MKNDRPAEILLVEDNEGDIELTRDAFEEASFPNSLNIAVDGDIAMDYLFKRNGNEDAITPDIILLDLNLPGTDGKDVLETIKADENLRRIPVIVLSSSNAETDIRESYDLHANCYVVKPMTASQFIDVVQHVEKFWVDIVRLSAAD